jgi:hypothetical protein
MYRQSYENGSPDETHFLNAKACLSSPQAKSPWQGSDLIFDAFRYIMRGTEKLCF